MQPGESVAVAPPLAKVSLDYNDPDSCIFLIEKKDRRFQSYARRILPDGWTEETDQASGQNYYVNNLTGQTQWEVPL